MFVEVVFLLYVSISCCHCCPSYIFFYFGLAVWLFGFMLHVSLLYAIGNVVVVVVVVVFVVITRMLFCLLFLFYHFFKLYMPFLRYIFSDEPFFLKVFPIHCISISFLKTFFLYLVHL